MSSPYLHRVPRPKPDEMNGGLSALKTDQLKALFGAPNTPQFKKRILPRLVTQSVGPFRVTGLDIAVVALSEALAEVHSVRPDLYALLGTAGMLCIRLVRGSTTAWSNHSYGCAEDFTIDGELDVRGDGMVQQGLLDLYPIMHAHGFYWGAEYATEDAMHFELAWETFQRLNAGH